jgi:hypothetical protein
VGSLRRLPLILLMVLIVPAIGIASGPFDSPVKVRHMRLDVKRQISCYYYRSIVVKQIDYGEVGADRLALLPVLLRDATPCREARETTEYTIPSDTWSGYFEGVKDDYAFFRAADGTNGGLNFMVLRIYDRKPVFEDTAQRGIHSVEIQEGALKLRYQRVFQGSCSVERDDSCREALARDTGVAAGSLSICAGGYQVARQNLAKARCAAQPSRDKDCIRSELAAIDQQGWGDAPTVIVYEVEAILKGDSRVFNRRSDALLCHPAD